MRLRVMAVAAAAVTASTLAAGTALASASPGAVSAATGGSGGPGAGIKHVLLISVDGLHQQDLAWYVKTYPDSLLATLESHGLEYRNAQTPFPSDSSPGMVAQPGTPSRSRRPVCGRCTRGPGPRAPSSELNV